MSNKKNQSVVIVILFAILWSFLVLGPRPLHIRDVSWLWGDLAQVYTAWVQFLSDSNTHWLHTNRLSYPLEMSVSLFDPMPILLLTVKLFANVSMYGTQFFGFYFVLCLILQGIFGYLATSQLLVSYRDDYIKIYEIAKVVTGILFVIMPFTFLRFLGHTALSSQWLLALSIWIVIKTRNETQIKWILYNCGVLFLASGINPYLAFMVAFNITLFSIFDFENKISFKSQLVRIFGALLTAYIGFYVFGFMSASGVSTGDYGIYSMNILGPFDSNGMARLLPFDVNDATGGQHFEGFNYLGLGAILLIFTVIAISFKSTNKTKLPMFAGIIIILTSFLLSLSTTLTLSNEVLIFQLPDFVTNLLSRFRASGRFFWIGGFWLIVLSVAYLATRLTEIRAITLLIFLLIVQIIDVSGVALNAQNSINKFSNTSFDLKINQLPLSSYKALIVLQPWQCDNQATPGGLRNYESFGFFAAYNNIPTNNFYAARTLPEQLSYHCNYEKILSKASPENLYVLSRSVYERFNYLLSGDIRCVNAVEPKDSFLCTGVMHFK